MARKRLNPTPFAAETPLVETKSSLAPIAQVGSDAAAQAALEEVSQELQSARAEGRLIQSLTLASIDKTHLMRDRVVNLDEDMEALMASLKARGQQTPIEVVETAPGQYGLISGWRRMTALERLGQTHVQARVRAPEGASDAYIAMVEENEIRVGLSYYERARITLRAQELGIFPDRQAALQGLFGHASRAKRSKIGSFMTVVDALDGALRFPAAIPERVGLPLAKALAADGGLGDRLRQALMAASHHTPEAELTGLMEAWKPKEPPARTPAAQKTLKSEIRPGVFLEMPMSDPSEGAPTRLTLSGPGVDPAFRRRLEAWLRKA